jgi:hypothetical protein
MGISNVVSLGRSTGVLSTDTANPFPISELTAIATNARGTVARPVFVGVLPPATDKKLVADLATYKASSDPMPGYLAPYEDPSFGTLITRISDNGNPINLVGGKWAENVYHQYSAVQAWNADESLLYLAFAAADGGRVFLDGETYAPVYNRSTPAGMDDARWSTVNPSILYYTTSNQQRAWDVPANTTSLVHRFTGFSTCRFGSYEGSQSNDDDIFPISSVRDNDGHEIVHVYKKSTDTVLGTVDVTALGETMSDGAARISPDGDLLNLYFDWRNNAERQAVYTVDGTQVYFSDTNQLPSHADWCKDGSTQIIVGSSSAGSGDVIRRGRELALPLVISEHSNPRRVGHRHIPW